MITNGFIYEVVKVVIDNLKYLNLVELFKAIAKKIKPNQSDEYSKIAVDIFIVMKWIFVSILIFLEINNSWITVFVWYLIATNLYTYFYYHNWIDESLNTSNFDNDRIRRRFVNLILAICFSNYSFSYLYKFPYNSEFSWISNEIIGDSFTYSICNSITANYDLVKPISSLAFSISTIQIFISFIFITIVISRSIPQKS